MEAVFEDGSLVPRQRDVIDIIGPTEKPSGPPCLCLSSRMGGVHYRLKQVSKRFDDRKVCIRLSIESENGDCQVTSEGTLVYSKRKNKDMREEQQRLEREELERKESDAVTQVTSSIFLLLKNSFEYLVRF